MPRRTLSRALLLALSMSCGVGAGRAGTALDLGDGVTMAFAVIPAGSFTLGSPASEAGREPCEGPPRSISLARPFLLGRTEVTQAQWQAVMASNPSTFKGPARPVENVSWEEARDFCRRLTLRTGRTVRLPSEAEWEYAARAGSVEPWYGPLDAIAWYDRTSGKETHDVGTKGANAWGLVDMLGNVWELCEDVYRASYDGAPTDGSPVGGDGKRVLRGGSWNVDAAKCRVAVRRKSAPDARSDRVGFRVVGTPAPAPHAPAFVGEVGSCPIEGYSGKPGTLRIRRERPGGYVFEFFDVSPRGGGYDGTAVHGVSAQGALSFRTSYYDAKRRVLGMSAEEATTTPMGGGGLEHEALFVELAEPPLKVKISNGYPDDPRRRVKWSSTDLAPSRYANFGVVLTGEGTHHEAFEDLLARLDVGSAE